MNPEVTVIIPTLNEEKFIEKCLDSVIKQTYPFQYMELFVIDGGSSDRTCEIVYALSQKHPNIYLLRNVHKIQSVAFNIGVKKSSAPYIIRLDAHAIYDSRYVELSINALKENKNIGNVGGRWDIIPQEHKIIAEANAVLNKVSFGIGGAAFRVGRTAGYVDTVPFGAFPREVLEEVGGMNERLDRGEDNEYNCRIRKAGYLIYFNPQIKSFYFARKSLCSSMKQMYSNGYSIGRLLFIDYHSVSLRHLVPFFFVISLLIASMFSFFSVEGRIVLGAIMACYILTDLLASVIASVKFGLKNLLVLPFFFFVIHVAYGLGTIIAILKKGNI